MFDVLKNKLKQTKEQAEMVVENTIKLPQEVRNKRLEVCKTCDQFHSTQFCKICGCFMPVKTYIPSTECPLKKWKAEV